jgi:hypothetical protein
MLLLRYVVQCALETSNVAYTSNCLAGPTHVLLSWQKNVGGFVGRMTMNVICSTRKTSTPGNGRYREMFAIRLLLVDTVGQSQPGQQHVGFMQSTWSSCR